MSKLNFFKYALIALGILNVILITVIILGRPSPGPPPGGGHRGGGPPQDGIDPRRPKVIVQEKLGLDESQSRQFELLIGHHREAINASSNKLFKLRQAYYESVALNDESKIDSLNQLIAEVNANIENIHQVHFKDIKGLLREDQLNRYQLFLNEVPYIFFHERGGPRK